MGPGDYPPPSPGDAPPCPSSLPPPSVFTGVVVDALTPSTRTLILFGVLSEFY